MNLKAMFARQRVVHTKDAVFIQDCIDTLSKANIGGIIQAYRNTGHPRIAARWEAALKQTKGAKP